MDRWVEIEFDCLPLRSITRFDAPIDASPKYEQFCRRVKAAVDKHGSHNTFYLHNARCVYHLLNHASRGSLEFSFEGTVLTDQSDVKTKSCDLNVELVAETVDWLTETVVKWFAESVSRSVAVEFDRYIEAGDLDAAKKRIEKIQQASDEADGFVGMYL